MFSVSGGASLHTDTGRQQISKHINGNRVQRLFIGCNLTLTHTHTDTHYIRHSISEVVLWSLLMWSCIHSRFSSVNGWKDSPCSFFRSFLPEIKEPNYRFLFRSGILTDLFRSAPSLPLWKCFGYFVLVSFGIELLVGVSNVFSCKVRFIVLLSQAGAALNCPPRAVLITKCSQCTGLIVSRRSCLVTRMTVSLFCPQVASFFHRAMLTVGLAVLSLWPFLSGLFAKAKVTMHWTTDSTVTVLKHKEQACVKFCECKAELLKIWSVITVAISVLTN